MRSPSQSWVGEKARSTEGCGLWQDAHSSVLLFLLLEDVLSHHPEGLRPRFPMEAQAEDPGPDGSAGCPENQRSTRPGTLSPLLVRTPEFCSRQPLVCRPSRSSGFERWLSRSPC